MTIATPNCGDTAIQSSTIKAVIFDLDGTLLDTEALSCRAVIESFAICSLIIPEEILGKLRDGGNLLPWDLKRRILGLRGSEWVPIVLSYAQENWRVDVPSSCQDDGLVHKFWRAWEERLNELCAEVEACPGAPELVQALAAARVPLAIATSSRAASVKQKRCKHEKMFQSFQEIVTGDDPNVLNGKPAPDIYLEAAKRLGVHPSECLVFEDAVPGAQSGKAAGCNVVAVPDSRIEKTAFRRYSDEIIDDLGQFHRVNKWGIPLERIE